MPGSVVRHISPPVLLLAASLLADPAWAEPAPTYLSQWAGGSSPRVLVTGGSGSLYFTDDGAGQHRVFNYTESGGLINQWGGAVGMGPGQFNAPNGIAVGLGGVVYVCDTGNHRVQRFSSSGVFLDTWGTVGSLPGQFQDPDGLAVDGAGQVYVTDHHNRIQVFSASGVFIRQFSVGTIGGALAIDPSGGVFIAGDDRIWKYTLDGAFQTMWGLPGSAPGQFSGISALALDQAGNIYVSDSFNARVQKFTSNGGYLSQWGSFGTNPGQFVDPRGLAVLPSGDILVSDRLGRFQRFRPCINCPGNTSTGRPKLLLHLAAPVTKNPCGAGDLADCAAAVTEGSVAGAAGPYYNVYLLVVPRSLSSVAGIQFGIAYQDGRATDIGDHVGVDIYSWTQCATLEFATSTPAWPVPGAGNTITWDPNLNCQSGDQETIVAGYFYVGAYSTDRLWLIPHPDTDATSVADCASAQSPLDARELGAVAFSPGAALDGCNPCLMVGCQPEPPVTVQPGTWSSIKALFRDRR